MTPKEFSSEKKKLIAQLKRTIKPFLWTSGYIDRSQKGGHTRLWVPLKKDGGLRYQTFKLRGAFVLADFDGFTSDGVITDRAGGGLASLLFEQLPIEDLHRLCSWAQNYFKDKTPQLPK